MPTASSWMDGLGQSRNKGPRNQAGGGSSSSRHDRAGGAVWLQSVPRSLASEARSRAEFPGRRRGATPHKQTAARCRSDVSVGEGRSTTSPAQRSRRDASRRGCRTRRRTGGTPSSDGRPAPAGRWSAGDAVPAPKPQGAGNPVALHRHDANRRRSRSRSPVQGHRGMGFPAPCGVLRHTARQQGAHVLQGTRGPRLVRRRASVQDATSWRCPGCLFWLFIPRVRPGAYEGMNTLVAIRVITTTGDNS